MAKKIIFKIEKGGKINAEVKGVGGSKCLDYLDLLQEITEGEIIEQEKTSEYYQTTVIVEESEIQNKQ